MSTPIKRPTKPKVTRAKPTHPHTNAPEHVPDPAPAPVVPEEVAPVENKVAPKRSRVSDTVETNISVARVRRHIDKLNLNRNIDQQLAPLKAQLAKYNTADRVLTEGKTSSDDGTRDLTSEERASYQATLDSIEPELPGIESKIAALSRERTRFSNDAAVSLSIICDLMIQQLTHHTMDRVLVAKKKIIQVEHLHSDGVKSLSLYPLFGRLPSFMATAERLSKAEENASHAAALAEAISQAEKDFRKKYDIKLPRKKAAPAEPAADAPPAAAADEEAEAELTDSKTSFKFYVGLVCRDIMKKDPKYQSIRISTEIRSYLSDLIVEFIQRISSLVHLTAMSMKNKTINESAILRTVEALMIDGHSPLEVIKLNEAQVPDPEHHKKELAAKEAAKGQGVKYTINLDSLPKVSGYVATRSITYPTSGYANLHSTVRDKLTLYLNRPTGVTA